MNLVGFVNALLININLIAGLNDPQTKITPVGFLRMLYENNAATNINNLADLRAGHTRDIKVRYMQRGVESEVSSTDDCEISIKPEWKETTIPTTQFSKIGIFISDEDMRKYQEEASQTLAAGTPSAPLMRALYETLRVKINGLLQKMDTNLVTAQNSKWGKNIAYGKNTAQTIALGATAGLNNGYVQLLADAQANEIADDLLVCGSGKVTQYDIYQRIKNGVDASGIASLPLNAYYDPKAATIWGADHFGVFAKGMIGIVDWCKNVGNYAGEKGGSIFFTLPMPLQVGDKVLPITFDAQLKYEDCPTEEHGRGWILLISKNYALFNAPTDAFAETDRLNGMNGSLHYVATDVDATQTVAPAANAVFTTKAQA